MQVLRLAGCKGGGALQPTIQAEHFWDFAPCFMAGCCTIVVVQSMLLYYKFNATLCVLLLQTLQHKTQEKLKQANFKCYVDLMMDSR